MPAKKKRLVREGEPSQWTKTGLEIPIVKTEDFDRLLRKAATKRTTKNSGTSREFVPNLSALT